MVYIHGGGFYLHNAHEYPPIYFLEKDVVLIVIQYRLDALGNDNIMETYNAFYKILSIQDSDDFHQNSYIDKVL